ncbi:MAG: sigma-70 family RNA polymerase sigma factor [Anaerolineae bacterium]|jgi:RNA polymerase sigma-70 factor (ECF subfamily)|nr:sigma-70 family RNA polymerase sigma factor [Anaerolineae bacterium]MCZ7553698.1 sigma-70 family RNA polymerase sigma factor [Anaerolineales bacterium]
MIQRTNEQWLAQLKSSGPTQAQALSDLKTVIEHGLPYALSPYLSPSDPRFPALIEDVSQAALLRALDRLDTFEGRSQFTTWAQKIAVRLAFTELRRKRWENVSLESLLEDPEKPPPLYLQADPELTPERQTEAAEMVRQVEQIIAEELTEKQRQAILALIYHEMPMDEASRQLDTNRNALYKLLHDARLRLKARLAEHSLTPADVLAALEGR